MGLKKKMVVVKVAVMLFLLGFTAKVDARFDPISLLSEEMMDGEPSYLSKYRLTIACCDKNFFTRSRPPRYRCADIKETCHAACGSCACKLSSPPLCRRTDVMLFSYGRCTCPETTSN